MQLLDITQLCEKIRVKKKTIYDWTHKGSIPYIKLGRLLRFDPDDIDRWLKKRKHPKSLRS